MKRFFSFDGDCLERHDTLEQARAAAESAIAHYRDDAEDGWPELTDNVCYGEIVGAAQEFNRQPITPAHPMHGAAEETVDYRLEAPAAHRPRD